MRMNRIQFQPGMSMPEVFKLFGREEFCAAALENARWPDGFTVLLAMMPRTVSYMLGIRSFFSAMPVDTKPR